jgi:ketosteroid isomerase-like protein
VLPVTLVLGVLAGCASTSTTPITLPSAGADARTVLSVYLKALKAGDCQTARQLTTSTFSVGNGELCGALKVLSYTEPGQAALPGNGEAIFPVELTVTGGDGSLRQGENTWFYDLKQQPDGQWRLVGGGSGP